MLSALPSIRRERRELPPPRHTGKFLHLRVPRRWIDHAGRGLKREIRGTRVERVEPLRKDPRFYCVCLDADDAERAREVLYMLRGDHYRVQGIRCEFFIPKRKRFERRDRRREPAAKRRRPRRSPSPSSQSRPRQRPRYESPSPNNSNRHRGDDDDDAMHMDTEADVRLRRSPSPERSLVSEAEDLREQHVDGGGSDHSDDDGFV